MDSRDIGGSPSVQGRAVFEIHCAPCHGPSGAGGYFGPHIRPPRISGVELAKIAQQVRQGGKEMPAFSAEVLPDASLHDLEVYIHETLARPSDDHGRLGPRDLDPFSVGLIAWVALVCLASVLAVLFAEGRH